MILFSGAFSVYGSKEKLLNIFVEGHKFSKMKKWKFGVIGTGMIGDFHARAIQSLANAELVGFYGTNAQKTAKLVEKYGSGSWHSLSKMLDSDDVEIVTIATPSGSHMEIAVEAAKKGKHVICEKPLEITLDRIDQMIAAHEKAGTRLGGIFNFRFNDPVRLLKKAVDSGRFGTITYASVHVPWWRNEGYYKDNWHGTWKFDGGGALMNQSIHMVDLLQYLIGPVKSLKAYTATLGHSIEVEDTAASILHFKNNALGVIYGSTASFPGQFRRLEITGTKGSVVQVENSFKVWQFADESEEDREMLKAFGEIEGGGGVSDPAAIQFQPHARNIAAFIHAIENQQSFEIEGWEARKSVEIILAIYEASKTHNIIHLDQK
jgi:UDP-N-acetyl-2-amino-2-deoxyglucuronate dehydrogenase